MTVKRSVCGICELLDSWKHTLASFLFLPSTVEVLTILLPGACVTECASLSVSPAPVRNCCMEILSGVSHLQLERQMRNNLYCNRSDKRCWKESITIRHMIFHSLSPLINYKSSSYLSSFRPTAEIKVCVENLQLP